jgi:hypothetical protein
LIFLYIKDAGRKAFGLMIRWKNNPYGEQPFHDLWADGWRQSQRQFMLATGVEKK